MSTKRRLLAGDKFSGSHSTLIKEAEEVVAALKKLPEVTKIVIDRIVPVGRVKSGVIKVTEESKALKISVKGSGAVQILYVYGTDWNKIKDLMLWMSAD